MKILRITISTILLLSCATLWSQVAINLDESNPDPSAMLDVKAIGMGLLAPRMNFAQRPGTPATGLLIYQTDSDPGYYYYDGVAWQKVGRASDLYWKANGMNIYFNSGNVGIGTITPGTSLHISGPGTSTMGQLSINDSDGTDPFLTFYGEGTYKAHLGCSGSTAWLSTVDASNLILQGYASNTGNVGIGWNVNSDKGKQIMKTKDGKETKAVSHKLTVYNTSDNYVLRLIGTDGSFGHGARFNFGDGNYAFIEEDEDDALHFYSATRTAFTGSNVGIGTLNPSQKLDVDYGDAIIQGPLSCDAPGEQGTLYLGTIHHYIRGEYGYGVKIGTYGPGDVIFIKELSGNVGIGTDNPTQKLTVRGNIRVESAATGLPVVELGEGLDYAEGFNVNGNNVIKPGTVLVIDLENPGELQISKKAYDTKVAGIVAGANDLGSGVMLGAGQFDCNVALAGRVYCNVDASIGEILPGDLLTTSNIPGYAMPISDRDKAQGAILGKAMEGLEKGEKGQILVLVTLQ